MPGLVIVIPVRFPEPSMLATAVAPVPPPPVIVTTGVPMRPPPVVARPVADTPFPVGAFKASVSVMPKPLLSMVPPPALT